MIDETDTKLINLFLENGKSNYNTIAKQLDITPATVHNRLHKLQETGILRGFQPKLDLEKLGYKTTVVINTRIKRGETRTLANKYKTNKNIISIYDISGRFDLIMIGKFKNVQEVNAFIKKLQLEDVVLRTETWFAFEVPKEASAPWPLE